MSTYIVFCKHNRNRIANELIIDNTENVRNVSNEIIKECARQYKNMNKEERNKYENLAK